MHNIFRRWSIKKIVEIPIRFGRHYVLFRATDLRLNWSAIAKVVVIPNIGFNYENFYSRRT